MTDEEAIRNCIGRYFHLLDDRDFDGWKKLLTSDATVTINGVGAWPPTVQIMGQRGRHIAVNMVIDVADEEATVVFDYFYIGEIGPARLERLEILNAGRYTDRLVRQDGQWLLREVAINVFR